MNTRYLYCLLILLSCCVLNVSGNSGLLKFRHLTSDDGLSSNQVHCFYKDQKGFLWIGTMNGLSRYDGCNFKVFKYNQNDSTSLRDNFVLKLIEDSNNYLWVLSRNSSLCFYNPHTETFIKELPLMNKNIAVPQNNISDINKDHKGRVWITNDFFGIYICDFEADSVIHLQHKKENSNSISSNSISSMHPDGNGNYWIVSRQGVIEKINGNSLEVEERIAVFADEIDSKENFRLFVDNDMDVWIYSESRSMGVKMYDRSTKKIVKYAEKNGDFSISNDVVKGVVQNENDLIYIGMDHGGINIIDKNKPIARVVKSNKGDPYSLPDNSITTMYYDNTGILWVGTYKNGIAYYHPDFFNFEHYFDNPLNPEGLNYNDINCFTEDDEGNVYIGTNGDGLYRFNTTTYVFDKINYSNIVEPKYGNNVVISLLFDADKRLWIGTYFGGLYVFDGKKSENYKHNPYDQTSISNDRIWSIFQDSRKNIWIGTLGGGIELWKPSTKSFEHYNSEMPNGISSNFVFAIDEDIRGDIWFTTIYGANRLDVKTKRFHCYLNNPKDNRTLTNNKSQVVKCSSTGRCWIGTSDGLSVYNPDSKTFQRLGVENGLQDNTIVSIEEDNDGNMWVGTPKGLAKITKTTVNNAGDIKYSVHAFDETDGLSGNGFNERASFKTSSGKLLFGSVDGFNMFDPKSIENIKTKKKLVFLQFDLFNKEVQPNKSIEGRIILTNSIDNAKEITLRHDENFFSISFVAIDFFHPKKLCYQYRLDGFKDNWFEADNNSRKATFTNLDYGTYKFRVRVSDNGKFQNNEQAVLTVNILPPFWVTTWAIGIYVLLFLLFLLGLRMLILRKEREKNKRANEKQLMERNEELNQLKIKFFTNVSHEFRTPLTLILSPLKKIINNTEDANQKKQIELVQRNAKRLLNLVNQLLDFRKMEVGQLYVTPSVGDIVLFVNEKVDSFKDYPHEKEINLSFESACNSMHCLFDHDKLEKVIFNLLSNAFKFTQRGSISVVMDIVKTANSQTQEDIVIKVLDTGIGIVPEKQQKIFDRFFQDNTSNKISSQGSGIGLSLTKEYVQLHGGTITVESIPEQGSTFTVCIPLNRHTTGETNNEIDDSIPEQTQQENTEIEHSNTTDSEKAKPVVFIVEDDYDLRFYLKENLISQYNVVEVNNGEHALLLLKKHKPALIVSDVMMPKLSGTALCNIIKNDKRYSHIPIILLTARITDDQKLEGLQLGADDYITKPFSFEILEAKIKNMIAFRNNVFLKIVQAEQIKPSEICITTLDEKLLQKAIDVVEKNLDNSEFTADKMASLMGVSRAHLYNKLSGIIGKTPAEFIKVMRLKRSVQLLEKSQLTISEISYDVGYNGSRYFSKHFKEQYGYTPSKYQQMHKAK